MSATQSQEQPQEAVVAYASGAGKVLIIGGYLVVEAPNIGISVAVNARFTTRIVAPPPPQPAAPVAAATAQPASAPRYSVLVESPQFGKSFEFFVDVAAIPPADGAAAAADSQLVVYQEEGSPRALKNPFLAYSILYSLALLLSGHNFSGEHPPPAGLPASAADRLRLLFSRFPETEVAAAPTPVKQRQLKMVLLGDNDFYSQQNWLAARQLPLSPENLRKVPPQAPLIGAVSKTGLGSSAALTVSVVGALISFGRAQLQLGGGAAAPPAAGYDDCVEVMHRVAQAAHCVAQGKIGSGFDVFTAIYGTSAYSRFAADRIEPLMPQALDAAAAAAFLRNSNVAAQPADVASVLQLQEKQDREVHRRVNAVRVFSSTVASVVGHPGGHGQANDWFAAQDGKAVDVDMSAGLPACVDLMLADVHAGGTETPGMVAKVFAWKKTLDAKDPTNLWNRVAAANNAAAKAFATAKDVQQRLTAKQQRGAEDAKADQEDDGAAAYAGAIADLSKLAGSDDAGWAALRANSNSSSGARQAVVAAFDAVRLAMRTCRQLQREMGVAAGVEIEPPALTPLLDATLAACPGVLAVGCPGAGGYDAVFALCLRPGASSAEQQQDDGSTMSFVERFWQEYRNGLSVCPLLVRAGGAGIDCGSA